MRRTCRDCRHFDDDPLSIEAQLPGLTTYGSAFGSVMGRAGLCAATGRLRDPCPADRCRSFAPIEDEKHEAASRTRRERP